MASDFLKVAQQQVKSDLQICLDLFDLTSPLKEAVHHAVMLGGKRIRPALCYACADLGSVGMNKGIINPAMRRAAVAVELIHCYSLCHDDLPCMDDDELRRGEPTCHVAFGEATALLAGDVLQSIAFEVLSSQMFETLDSKSADPIRLRQVQILASASTKMVVGQVMDLQGEGKFVDQNHLEQIHLNKTGALIEASVMMGAVSNELFNSSTFLSLSKFARKLGLAYQVQDDILDITTDTKVLGKTAGKDQQVAKSTYPALMGLENAKHYAQKLFDESMSSLNEIESNTEQLYKLSEFLINRRY